MEVDELGEVVGRIEGSVAAPIVSGVVERLRSMVDIGLGYLSLDRETSSLSGGESQRIKMVRHLGSGLVDIMYVFDEPTIGLHPRDVHRLNSLLRKLRDKGNTVLVVEHDPDVIEAADHVVDIGPRAGSRGGEIVFEGDVAGLKNSGTLTGESLKERPSIKTDFREPSGYLTISDATLHNLKDVTVDVPTGVFTVVTGVAGSGKSTLIGEVFARRYPEAVVIDQSAVGRSSRSNPATYTGIMDEIRGLFARANDVSPSLFSFNSRGACPNCQGLGSDRGELVEMNPIGSGHAACVAALTRVMGGQLRDETDEMLLWIRNPGRFSESHEPQPDLAGIRPRDYRDSPPTPEDVLFLIEVSDTTLAYDRGVKLPLYARAGILEVWIVNLAGEEVERHAEPTGDGYRRTERARRGEMLASVSLPGTIIPVDEVLGPASRQGV